jgi:hypothetical protein
MIQRWPHARALLLGIVASIGLLAVGAASAQAAPEFYREGILIASTENIPAVGEGGPFILYVPELGYEIICKKVSDEATYSNLGGKGTSKATIRPTECKVENFPACSVAPLVFKVIGQLLLHEGQIYTLLEAWPENSGKIATIGFEGFECPLFSGSLTGSTMNRMESGESVKRSIFFAQSYVTLICSLIKSPCGLKFGGKSAALLEGETAERLGVPYAGEKWGAK